MKKRLLALFLLLALVVVNGGVAAAASAEPAPVKIQIIINEDKKDWLAEMITAYQAVAPNVTVEQVILEGAAGDRQSKITMLMQSPQTCPDVMMVDGFKINADSAAGYLSSLDAYVAQWEDWSQYSPNVMAMGQSVDGTTYGIPISVDVLGLWYDMTLFKEAGLPLPFEPKTWQDVLDAAIKLRDLNKPDLIPLYIYVAKTFPERGSMRLFQPLYNGTGHSIYDPQTGKWTINRQAALDVCNFVNTVCNVEKLAPPLDFGIQNAVETILQESYMKEHKVGIWLSGNWMASNWAEGKQYAWENVTDEVGFAKIPTQSGQSPYYTSMSGGWVWCVPELSQQKDAAWEFIKFICQKDNSLKMALAYSELSARMDVMAEPAYNDASRLYVKESTDIMGFTKFRPSLEVYPQVSLALTEAMEGIGMGIVTPEAAVDALIASLERAVGKENLLVE